MKLTIKHTSQYTGTIMIDNEIIVNLSQSFDEDGHMNGGTALYIQNKDKYYANLQECRQKEDEFKAEMRKIEDQSVISKDTVEDTKVETTTTTEDVENESEE
ncbi:hypothetical protein DWZ66_08090 [Coprobacillus sp. AF34-1BH]|nr:hypothetical protein DWX19_01625 [Coprobacillus sp. AF18-40]RGT87324.1 hypothetical protein DWX05_02195 [Coprobacillus sp. AF18-15LB]RHP24233.1 hypothetical protein DWZ66_08090 [Coprobacillus sp. AF34-1BH]